MLARSLGILNVGQHLLSRGGGGWVLRGADDGLVCGLGPLFGIDLTKVGEGTMVIAVFIGICVG